MAVLVEVGDLKIGDGEGVVEVSGGRELRKGIGNRSFERAVAV